MIKKNSGRHVRIAEDLFNGPRPRDQIFRACVSKDQTPPSTMAFDNGFADLFQPDQYVTQRSNRLPGDFSRRLIGSAVLRSRRDNA
jgi:hypothetical protein